MIILIINRVLSSLPKDGHVEVATILLNHGAQVRAIISDSFH